MIRPKVACSCKHVMRLCPYHNLAGIPLLDSALAVQCMLVQARHALDSLIANKEAHILRYEPQGVIHYFN